MNGPVSALLDDGQRMHLQHGPIDLIIEAYGSCIEVGKSYHQAQLRFETILDELVSELPLLRRPHNCNEPPQGETALRMAEAICPLSDNFITPMAAVAGAVADEILEAMVQGRDLDKAYVNNGGDIAVYLGPGETFEIGIATNLTPPVLGGKITLRDTDLTRGVATSGHQGRSLSLGIADAVTVLAGSAALADGAVTLLANAVDLPDHPAIRRQKAITLDPDSDLGNRLATVDVGPISTKETEEALESGYIAARAMMDKGLIQGAALCLNGAIRTTGSPCKQIEEAFHA